ncbi:T9SS type A sorting domain-containing protein [candidate division WOR-3 bacterium]|nr:T9SS type A sorting domain-containing protein [candidate division WOR-3 bacterium]
MKKNLLFLAVMVIVSANLSAGFQTHVSSERILYSSAPSQTVMNPFAVIFQQIPDTLTASGYACQLDSAYPFEADIADDVTVPAGGWVIDTVITWWSNWNGFTAWANVPNVHFVVWADAAGQPAVTPTNEYVCEMANYTATQYGSPNLTYRLTMDVTSLGIVIPEGTWWIEVQPSNVYTANGQTGLQAGVGIGNGNQMWFKSDVLGYPSWVTASTVWSSAYEMGVILIGNPNSVQETPVDVPSTVSCRLVSALSGDVAVELALPLSSDVSFRVMDVTGRTIGSKDLNAGAGTHTVSLDQNLGTGTYFYRLEASGNVFSGKIIVAE